MKYIITDGNNQYYSGKFDGKTFKPMLTNNKEFAYVFTLKSIAENTRRMIDNSDNFTVIEQ